MNDHGVSAYFVGAVGMIMSMTASEWLILVSIVAVLVRVIIDIPKAIKVIKRVFHGKS